MSGAARQFISLSEFRRSTEACVERGYLNEWYGETIVALCDVVVAARSIVWRKDDDGSIRVVEGLDKLEETLKRFM